MRYVLTALLTMVMASCTISQYDSYTTFATYEPTAPELQGFEWKKQECRDFVVYQYIPQILPESGSIRGVGMYIGDHPNVKTSARTVQGKFAGQPAKWTTTSNTKEGTRLHHWETLIEVQLEKHHFPMYVHAWVYAEQKADLMQLVKWSESVRFKTISEDTLAEE